MNRLAGRLAALLLGLAATGAQAGGPLSICNDVGKTPLAYSPATVNLNYDQGNLGSRTKAQADAIVTNAVALWTNVGTATITIGRGTDLPVNVDAAPFSPGDPLPPTSYENYVGRFSDGLNPVIYDTNGAIIDDYFGMGNSSSVLGFAGSAFFTAPTCRYVEGQAVINGLISVSDTTMSVVLAHEIGHLIGMDHTQLDSTQGLAGANYPLMYPIAFRSSVTLHDDDIAAVSALYPDATLNSVYGQISGTFVLADGVTPVLGANLWATETTTGKLYSIVSDYRTQGTGHFRLLLPAGTYNLRAEAIECGFDGGSSVGPYSDVCPTSQSFQPPLYTGSTPMATVTLGGGTPTSFTIVAGCAATLTFRIDGAGSVDGNCKITPVGVTRLGDLDGDGKSDVVWRNKVTGENVGWLMNGLTLSTATLLQTVSDVNWEIKGVGDISGDGKADIVWRNKVTGENVGWLMNGLTVSTAALLPTVGDLNWEIKGAGDLDGDGKADVLWRNKVTGENVGWLMNGLTVSSSALLPRIIDLNWEIKGAGDFDGDGKADVLWRNKVTGENVGWLMNGLTLSTSALLPRVGDLNWEIKGLGDLDGDGKADVLWRNKVTGENVGWLMNGLTLSSSSLLPTVGDLNWEIKRAGDISGDGKADVVWRNKVTGENVGWLMNGLTLSTTALLPRVADLNWEIVGP